MKHAANLNGNLYVGGTAANDVIAIKPSARLLTGAGGDEHRCRWVVLPGARSPVESWCRAWSAPTRIAVSAKENIAASLYGGEGNDVLTGRSGHDLLVGGDGNDSLVGGLGWDVLLGGEGADKLTGARGEDLLVGGPTIFDFDAIGIGEPSSPSGHR